MTWTLNLTGHVDSKEKEEEILEIVKASVSKLWGADAGILSGQFSGMFGTAESFTPGPRQES